MLCPDHGVPNPDLWISGKVIFKFEDGSGLMNHNTKDIRELHIFSKMNEKEITELCDIAIERTLIPDEYLFLEDDSPQYFYILKEGRIKSFLSSSLGKEFIVGFLGPGEILGPVSIFFDRSSTIGSMQAVSLSKVLGFRKKEFVSFILTHPQVSFEITRILAARMSEFCHRARDLAGEKVEQRIEGILLMLYSRLGNILPFTRQEVGEMVGATTETTIRVMCQLKEKGVIESIRGKIIIKDPAKLRSLISEKT
jgi:CRP-like cAMP-binding protein